MVFETPDRTVSNTATDYSTAAKRKFFARVVPVFAIMLLLTGLTIGGMITTGYATAIAGYGIIGYLLLLVVQIGVFVAAQATQDYYPLNIIFAVFFAVFEGIFLSPLIAGFLSAGLASILAQAFVITSVSFVGLAAYPYITDKDFSFLGPMLFVSVFGLIAISLLSFFVGFPGWFGLAVNVASIIIFSLFILYDMSEILNERFGAVAGAIALYLDFILLFINYAQLLAAMRDA